MVNLLSSVLTSVVKKESWRNMLLPASSVAEPMSLSIVDGKNDTSMWLENHIDEVIKTLKPGFTGRIRPHAKIRPLALAKLWSAVSSFGYANLQGFEQNVGYGYTRPMRWKLTTFEAFVNSKIGEYFTPEQWNVVRNSVRSIKAKAGGSRVILPGRDAFVWHVLLSKIGYPNLYDPRISRLVCYNPILKRIVQDEWKLSKDDYIVDTGFMGSIPKAINAASGKKLRWTMLSADESVTGWKSRFSEVKAAEKDAFDRQIFPKHKGSRALALTIESLPKYLESARMGSDGEIRQDQAATQEQIRAALFTIRAWYAY